VQRPNKPKNWQKPDKKKGAQLAPLTLLQWQEKRVMKKFFLKYSKNFKQRPPWSQK
jgi:hypothetical protein